MRSSLAQSAEQVMESLKAKLEELIPSYKEHKQVIKHLEEIAETENDEIKDYMGQLKVDRFTAGGWVAAVSETKKESLIEPLLLEKLKELRVKGIIKKKEYVDMDALEDAIYNKKIDASLLTSCKETKVIKTLRILKKKKGED